MKIDWNAFGDELLRKAGQMYLTREDLKMRKKAEAEREKKLKMEFEKYERDRDAAARAEAKERILEKNPDAFLTPYEKKKRELEIEGAEADIAYRKAATGAVGKNASDTPKPPTISQITDDLASLTAYSNTILASIDPKDEQITKLFNEFSTFSNPANFEATAKAFVGAVNKADSKYLGLAQSLVRNRGNYLQKAKEYEQQSTGAGTYIAPNLEKPEGFRVPVLGPNVVTDEEEIIKIIGGGLGAGK